MVVGNNFVKADDVEIGDNVIIGNNVTLHSGVQIGSNVRIDDNTVIGKLKMKSVISATTNDSEASSTFIGDGCIIGTNVVIYSGANVSGSCLIADLASVREEVSVGPKSVIGKGSTIENNVSIGSNCKIQSNVQIVPFSTVEDNVFIAPGVMTANDSYMGRTEKRFSEFKGVTLKHGCRIGVAAILFPGITVNEEGVVGGGAVVTRDVPAKTIVIGSPAKVLKDVPADQLLENQ